MDYDKNDPEELACFHLDIARQMQATLKEQQCAVDPVFCVSTAALENSPKALMKTEEDGLLVLAYDPDAFHETLEQSFYSELLDGLTDYLRDKEDGDLFMFVLTPEGSGGTFTFASS